MIFEEIKYKEKLMMEMNELFTKNGKQMGKKNITKLVNKTKHIVDNEFLIFL